MMKKLICLFIMAALCLTAMPVMASDGSDLLEQADQDLEDAASLYEKAVDAGYEPDEEEEESIESETTKTFQLGTSFYTLEIPKSYVEGELSEEDIDDSMAAHMYSPESELDFYVYHFGKIGLPDKLAELPKKLSNVIEIKTDLNVNGIRVSYGKAIEPFEDGDYNTLTYFLDNGDSYVEVLFRLGDETSEEQAKDIFSTLSFVGPEDVYLAFAAADDSQVFSLEDIIKTINESGYDIINLFDRIAGLVEIFMNDGETETVGNIIRVVGHLVNTIINGEESSGVDSELIRDLILDEESLPQLSSGAILDIYETSRDELIRRGIIAAE